ncbi:NAD(P)-dependent oxidoreductase [uncultured Amaricoccus sp.]|uniref:NAD(P)-dependent oxidoreductase n=1 Tax=uncultured Amaricoccus sp. TaxID=339341 RepID=UPI002636C737|nr:NAD(P)-dependent oxidoreductase [uncultured Amaricoccus sp.]
MALIFSTHRLHPTVTARLEAAGDYLVASAPTPEAILAEGTGAEVIVVRAPVPAEYFARARRLRAAVRHGAGLDMVPMEVATAAGVLVANVPGANASTVAEFAIFAAIALRRRFRIVDGQLRANGWTVARDLVDTNRELAGAVLGILGFGNIGRSLAGLGRAFGMRVIATTRRPETLPPEIEGVALDDLMARADVVVVCCPLTGETRGIIDSRRLAAMKPGAALVNVARGPIIDQAAAVAELRTGRISAALDVFETQPLPSDDPLFALPNVILTPHMSGVTEESMLRMGDGAADEVIRVLGNHLPVNFRNPEVEALYRTRFPV